ncbi:MAG: hypothetical protein HW418_3003 [Anaerolineales bacterium]|nr:hypothetical protein [Anaerolineales bacterium]
MAERVDGHLLAQDTARELVLHAGQRHALYGYPANRDRHPADDLLCADPGSCLRQRDLHHHPTAGRMVYPGVAPLGRERHDHTHGPAHAARFLLRRVQVSARSDLADRRRASARRRRIRVHRLPAAVGSKGLLGHDRRDAHRRGGARCGRVDFADHARRRRPFRRNVGALLRRTRVGAARIHMYLVIRIGITAAPERDE